MRITVLGKSPAWQDVDGACSGYLIEEDGAFLLMDCGNGVFSKLRRYHDHLAVDAVVISHLHADHFLDLVPYAYALIYGSRLQADVEERPAAPPPPRPRLLVPPGGGDLLRRVTGAWGAETLIADAFDVVEYAPGEVHEVGPLRLRFHGVPHYVPTFAIDVRPAAGGDAAPRLTFGADSAPNDDIVAFAQGADLLMLEATLPHPEQRGPRGHLTPREAGEHARRAGARRLVVTHFSDSMDAGAVAREAELAFAGPVAVAQEGAVFEL